VGPFSTRKIVRVDATTVDVEFMTLDVDGGVSVPAPPQLPVTSTTAAIRPIVRATTFIMEGTVATIVYRISLALEKRTDYLFQE
jgi:hypothetical protein